MKSTYVTAVVKASMASLSLPLDFNATPLRKYPCTTRVGVIESYSEQIIDTDII